MKLKIQDLSRISNAPKPCVTTVYFPGQNRSKQPEQYTGTVGPVFFWGLEIRVRRDLLLSHHAFWDVCHIINTSFHIQNY